MEFEIIDTLDDDGEVTGVFLIMDQKLVDWFSDEGAATAHALDQFTFNLMKAINASRSSAALVFEQEDHRVLQISGSSFTYHLVIDPDGNVVPRRFELREAIEFIGDKLAVKFGGKNS